MARKMTAAQVSKALKDYSKEKLTELIVQIYRSNPEANDFLNVWLGGTEYAAALLQESKDSLDKIFFPRRRTKRFSMQDARAVVESFRRVCPDPEKNFDLELYCTEQAVEFAQRYEGMNDAFYTITESMLRSATGRIKNGEVSCCESKKDRLENLRSKLPGTGLTNLLGPVFQEMRSAAGTENPEEQTEPAAPAARSYTSEIGEILPDEDGNLFFELWWPLLNFVNKTKKVVNKKVIKEGEIQVSELKRIANRLWGVPELIDDYLNGEGKTLPEDHQNIIRGWKRAVSGRFVMERHMKNGSILISLGDERVYLVHGIKSSLEEMFFGWHLPVVMDATLIPFRNVIICDGLIIPLSIHLGSGITKNLRENYMTAKRQREILTSL